ncbi:MAG: DUF6077 domain-containing protein [Bilifractor sp.]|jgi:hypothetical protein
MSILSIPGLIAVFLVIPGICGFILTDLLHIYESSAVRRFALNLAWGNLLMWAAFEAVAVPMILLRQDFRNVILLWLLILAAAVIIFVSARKKAPFIRLHGKQGKHTGLFRDRTAMVLLLLLLVIAGFQCAVYLFGMHLDEDDSRFIAHAVYTWKTDRMLTENPATGELNLRNWGGDYLKDAFSPWMIYIAMVSRLAAMHPAVLAHTVLPVILLILGYLIYCLIGVELFDEDRRKALLFCVIVAFLQLFFAGSTDTQSEFALLRIWQGKAVAAGVGIPMILYCFVYLYRHTEEERAFWILLIADWACCLLSGMGIILAASMIGICSVWYIFAFRKWKMIWKVPVVLLPSVCYGGIYYLCKIGRIVL